MATDILLQSTPSQGYDLQIHGGDFVAGPSDEQHVAVWLASAPGHFKQAPLIGADLGRFLKTGQASGSRILQFISENAALDGLQLNDLEVTF
jgi:hypothetical protein